MGINVLVIFWIITVALALLVTLVLILAMKRSGGADELTVGYDLQVYREQLREVEKDQERGVIAPEDAERVKVEISRRILAADARGKGAKADVTSGLANGLNKGVVVAMAALVMVGSGALYFVLGAPGRGDLGLKHRIEIAREVHETRPSQDEAEARTPPTPPIEVDPQYKALIDQLREKVAEQPEDLQGQMLLAHHEAQSGNLEAARMAQAKVLQLMGDRAGAEEFAQFGELLIVAANGYVSPEAESALRQALERDGTHGPARYYWGLMLAQTGRPDLAFRIWDRTLRQSPAGSPWLGPIQSGIAEMAWLAGIADYEVPQPRPALAGPSSQDVNAAAGMSAEARQEMIQGMVAQLSERLANEGGKPGEWAQLIGALGVLGNTDRAQAIYNEAKQVFAGNEAALEALNAAAAQAGLDG